MNLLLSKSAAVEAVARAIEEKRYESFLLHGVTGSGKTEVYLQLAARTLAAGRNVIVMVPEIALADEVVRSFRARFGSLVGIAHSAQNVTERWASWTAALSGEARIMIGPRSLIFAPLHDAGLIVVDEEHDPAYKSEEGIRYHARDLAVVLARFTRCPVVLGSATPSAESFANTRRGRYHLLRLPTRVNDRAMASVEVIDLRMGLAQARAAKPAEKKPDAVPLSPELIDALRENLASGGQSMVFLNRRGYHNFLAMQRMRQRDRMSQLQRQHDVSSARPHPTMPLLRESNGRARAMSRMQRAWPERPGLRHRAAAIRARRTDADRENRADGQRHQRTQGRAGRYPRGVARAVKSMCWSAPR